MQKRASLLVRIAVVIIVSASQSWLSTDNIVIDLTVDFAAVSVTWGDPLHAEVWVLTDDAGNGERLPEERENTPYS